MRIDIVSIFPEFFSPLSLSLVGKAQEKGILKIAVHDLRDHTDDPHRTVDDAPYGGGAGMVMKADVWQRSLETLLNQCGNPGDRRSSATGVEVPVLMIPTPSGQRLTQLRAQELSQRSHLIFACGRYEGIDSRFAQAARLDKRVEVVEFSLGDYVLNGGEVASLVAIEAITRLVPGVVGNSYSLVEESHSESGLLEYPIYTRPRTFQGIDVPEELLGGDHQEIDNWRHQESLKLTLARRPDLLGPRGKAHENLSVGDLFICLEAGFFPPDPDARFRIAVNWDPQPQDTSSNHLESTAEASSRSAEVQIWAQLVLQHAQDSGNPKETVCYRRGFTRRSVTISGVKMIVLTALEIQDTQENPAIDNAVNTRLHAALSALYLCEVSKKVSGQENSRVVFYAPAADPSLQALRSKGLTPLNSRLTKQLSRKIQSGSQPYKACALLLNSVEDKK